MLDLAGADAERQRAECTVGRGVAVAAHDCHARLGQPLLRPDDVDDALTDIVHPEIGDAEALGIPGERLHLKARLGIRDPLRAIRGGNIMIGNRCCQFGPAHLAPGKHETFERLRTRHLVNEMTIDIQHRRSISVLMNEMTVPDLVVESLCCAHRKPLAAAPSRPPGVWRSHGQGWGARRGDSPSAYVSRRSLGRAAVGGYPLLVAVLPFTRLSTFSTMRAALPRNSRR